MTADFSGIADDYYLNLNINTTMDLPTNRETVLQFCEAASKDFPAMTGFFQRETGEYVLEGNHESGSYPWMELQPKRIAAGFFNPDSVDRATELHRWILNRSTFFLGVSPLDVECLDLMVGFNLEYTGNRDAIVADALLANSPLAGLIGDVCLHPLECQPSLVAALDEECYSQARLLVETRSNTYQVRTGNYDPEPISIYFTLRQYPKAGERFAPEDCYQNLLHTLDEMTCRTIIPQIIHPIAAAIAASQ